ncbi:MAG: hypothetical protein LKE40_14805 [Spirochaetia bacterium]|nr:hypothetical protein [Spirochaetia bacterium]
MADSHVDLFLGYHTCTAFIFLLHWKSSNHAEVSALMILQKNFRYHLTLHTMYFQRKTANEAYPFMDV